MPAVVAAWVLIAAGALCLLARSVTSINHVLVLSACASPYAPLLLVAAGVILGVGRHWVQLAVAIVVLIALLVPLVPTALRRPVADSAADGLTVMTFNMRLGSADAESVVREVGRHDVGLLMLQEMTPAALARLRAAGIDAAMHYSYPVPGERAAGVAVFSRYPLADERSYPGFPNSVISVRVSLPMGATLTAFSSHLGAPWPQNGTQWRVDSENLGRILASTPGTVIDAGDFNATTALAPFRSILATADVSDAAALAGEPSLRTYPADARVLPPLLGIDHVVTRGFGAHAVWTLHIPGSDHRALLARLVLDAR